VTEYEQQALQQGLQNIHLQGLLVVSSLVLAALALWGEKWKKKLFAPRLKMSIDLRPPYCQRFPAGTWFRVKVENNSSTKAENVEVWIWEIYRGSPEHLIRHDVTPIPLLWTHETRATIPALNPHFSRYCDFGRLLLEDGQPRPRLFLSTATEPAGGATHLAAGWYRICLTMTASNAKPQSAWFEFDVPNFDPPTEEVALSSVRLRLASGRS
jgi:hypothetical protein